MSTRQGHERRKFLQALQRRKFHAGGAIRPWPVEAVDKSPVGILFKPLKRQGTSGDLAYQALQLIPTVRQNRRVGMQGKAVDAGTEGAFAVGTFAFVAKA